jgi:predicted choloylglycine hydrolase
MIAFEARGDPFTVGLRHGEALRGKLQHFLSDRMARINAIRHSPLPVDQAEKLADAHARIIERETPHLAEELRGLARGAAIAYRDAVLLQIRREAIGWSDASGECTTFAMQQPRRAAVIAQNVDLNGRMSELAAIARIDETGTAGGEILMLTFGGLLGFLGLNAAGLAVGINFVNTQPWQPGVPPYLLVRHLLRLSTVEQCLAELRRITRSSSRCLTLCDSHRLVMVELTPDDLRVISGARLFHTNHYLHQELVSRDAMNPFSRRASQLRLQTIETLCRPIENPADPEALFEILSDHSHFPVGLCAHGSGDLRREETVASAVLYPETGRLHVRVGNTCRARSQAFSVTGSAAPVGGRERHAAWP